MTTTDTFYHTSKQSLKVPLSLVVAAVVTAVMISGCMPQASNSAGTAEEYQYKGKPDQLMSESAANRAGKLSERFKLIQARQ